MKTWEDLEREWLAKSPYVYAAVNYAARGEYTREQALVQLAHALLLDRERLMAELERRFEGSAGPYGVVKA